MRVKIALEVAVMAALGDKVEVTAEVTVGAALEDEVKGNA